MAPKARADAKAKAKAKAKPEPKAKARADPKAKAKAKPEPKARADAKAKAKAEPKARAEPKAKAAAKRESSASAPPAKQRKTEAAASSSAGKAAASGGGGRKVVDNRVPNAGSMQVVDDYAVKLNQTHIDANNNKYYIIQVLQSSDGKYYAWNRWGRVGEDGQNKLSPCGLSKEAAVKEFEKKFREKTQNAWAARDSFKPVNGKYSIVETEDVEGGGEQNAPMGKLTEAQIKKGQQVLDQIEGELQKGAAKASTTVLEKLSSEFYTLIPTNVGRARPPAIKDNDMLQAKVELLKFYLRMGFEEVEEEAGVTPIDGVMALPCPSTLEEAAASLCGKGDIKTSSSKGEELSSKQAGKPTKKMPGALYASIMLYTSNAIYRDLNQSLRDENRTKIKKYFRYLRLFFEAMAFLPKQKRTLWRGLSVDLHENPQYKVGNTVTWWGVTSTTADKKVAENFAKGCGKCTVVTLETETSSDISEITFYSNEKESLLAPGTQLLVQSNTRKGNVTEITLKEVGRVIG
mmetsp:Transcript_23653/g.55145  ORF Transcript_23653/g.55145 Transcript_23653/m.55145 type:complete len:518 (-) Transcript_23653:109-1662(-)